MAYVIQSPFSITNPKDSYVVVKYEDWVAYVNKEASRIPVHSAVRTYEEAQKIRDELNSTQGGESE